MHKDMHYNSKGKQTGRKMTCIFTSSPEASDGKKIFISFCHDTG